MHKLRQLMNVFALIALTVGLAAIARGQAPRTFVASFGNDANGCTRSAPCATFAGALGKTATNGEINCLDPSGYGAVTITKSITIDCEDTQGSSLASFTNGIVINLRAFSSSDPQRIVRLRGLVINGSGNSGASGLRGIYIPDENTAAITVHIDQVVIDNFLNEGILFNAAGGGELLVRNTTVQNCAGSGLRVNSSPPSPLVRATVENSSFLHNYLGVHVERAAHVTVSNSNISHNQTGGAVVITPDSSPADLNLYNCYITGNKFHGVLADSNTGLATVRLDGNHIVNNNAVGGGTVFGVRIVSDAQGLSRRNNTINGNDINVSGTLGLLPSL